MRPIPRKLRSDMAGDPYYLICARANADCFGRVTWEHAFIHGGRQISQKCAIIPLCEDHHLGQGLDKRINECLAYRRATPEELKTGSSRNRVGKLRG